MKKLTLFVITTTDSGSKLMRCLESVQPYVDELIIIDSGLRAAERELAAAAGAQLIACSPDADKADIMNAAAERAGGDWIMWLYDVEYLRKGSGLKLRDLLYTPSAEAVFLHVLDFQRGKQERQRIIDCPRPRLFRRHCGYSLQGKGDIVTLSFNPQHDSTGAVLASRVDRQQPVIVGERTALEAAALRTAHAQWLQAASGSEPGMWESYELACEYYKRSDYRRMAALVDHSILQFMSIRMLPPAIVYKLKYAPTMESTLTAQSQQGLLVALKLYPDCTDLHYYNGYLAYNAKNYEPALKAFQQCLKLGEDEGGYFTRPGTGSYQASYYRGQCWERLGNFEAAAYAYMELLDQHEACWPAAHALNRLIDSKLAAIPAQEEEDASKLSHTLAEARVRGKKEQAAIG